MCKMETWLLEDYAEGLLGVAETAILEAHLAVCEDCKRELTHIKLLFWEMESMRREPVSVPDALKGMESAILNEWLTDKENWLQHVGSQLITAAKQTAALLPGIPAADRMATQVAAVTGTASRKTAKWIGKTAFRLIRQKIRPTDTEKTAGSAKSGRNLETKRMRALISSLTGGGG